MASQFLLILIILLLVSWFLIVERQSVFEKIFIILSIAVVYAAYRVLTGATPDQIFTPIITFFTT